MPKRKNPIPQFQNSVRSIHTIVNMALVWSVLFTIIKLSTSNCLLSRLLRIKSLKNVPADDPSQGIKSPQTHLKQYMQNGYLNVYSDITKQVLPPPCAHSH